MEEMESKNRNLIHENDSMKDHSHPRSNLNYPSSIHPSEPVWHQDNTTFATDERALYYLR